MSPEQLTARALGRPHTTGVEAELWGVWSVLLDSALNERAVQNYLKRVLKMERPNGDPPVELRAIGGGSDRSLSAGS